MPIITPETIKGLEANNNPIPKPIPCPKERAIIILETQPIDTTMSILKSWFGRNVKTKIPFIDYRGNMEIPSNYMEKLTKDTQEKNWGCRYAKNWNTIKITTPGRYVVNNLIFSYSKNLRSHFDYINEPFKAGIISGIEQKMVDLFLEKKVDVKEYLWVLDCMQWIGYGLSALTSPSLTINTIRMPIQTRKLKEQLVKSELGRKAEEETDIPSANKLESELLNDAVAALRPYDPGMEIYDSGAKGNVGNNYKNVALMRGGIKDSAEPNKIAHVSLYSLEEGIPAHEMHHFANILTLASFGRSKSTATGGYIMKQINAAFQVVTQYRDPNSDCGTTKGLVVKIEDPSEFKYRFVMLGNGKLEEITSENIAQYKNKTVKIRSPLYCKTEKLCAKCLGTLYQRMGMNNVGLLAVGQGNGLMMASMKAFHDSTIKIKDISINDYLITK